MELPRRDAPPLPSSAAPHDILDLGRRTCSAPRVQRISGGVVVPLAARLSPLTTNEAIEKGSAPFYRRMTGAGVEGSLTNWRILTVPPGGQNGALTCR